MPARSSRGARTWAASSRAPEARSMYTAVIRAMREGTMRRRTSSPSAPPWISASYTSTPRPTPYRATPAMIRGVIMAKSSPKFNPSRSGRRACRR